LQVEGLERDCMDWNFGEIRKLIMNAFGDDEFHDLCFDHFKIVYDSFTNGQTKNSRIRALVEYAEKQQKVDVLLEKIALENPNGYAEYEPRLRQNISDPRQFAQAIAESTALEDKIFRESDKCEKDRLKTQIENRQEKINASHENLDDKKRANQDVSQFRNDIAKIDFSEIIKEVDKIIETLRENEGGDILFLLQDSFLKEGELCLRRIQEKFKGVTRESSFNHYRLDFHASSNLSEYGWLAHLRRYLNLEDIAESDSLAYSAINKICQLVTPGSIIFLEIHRWHELPSQNLTLASFLQKFWIPLVTRLNDKDNYPQVKLVAVLVVDSMLSEDCFQSPCLPGLDENIAFRWTELKFRNWKQQEIQDWLITYCQCSRSESEQKAGHFHQISEGGKPQAVRSALEREFLSSYAILT
jgi:hypothetical protein